MSKLSLTSCRCVPIKCRLVSNSFPRLSVEPSAKRSRCRCVSDNSCCLSILRRADDVPLRHLHVYSIRSARLINCLIDAFEGYVFGGVLYVDFSGRARVVCTQFPHVCHKFSSFGFVMRVIKPPRECFISSLCKHSSAGGIMRAAIRNTSDL